MREFHVDDLGDAIVFALEKWDPDSKESPVDINNVPLNYLNVGTGKDISIKELAEIISKEFGSMEKYTGTNLSLMEHQNNLV